MVAKTAEPAAILKPDIPELQSSRIRSKYSETGFDNDEE
jgi:hypothetical protein